MYGADGKCIETCGDGNNWGLHVCDDGNERDGDGCSSDCLEEFGYMCRGGFQKGKDTCETILSEISRADISNFNRVLILEFSRPISVDSPSDFNKDNFIIQIETRDGDTKDVSFDVRFPSNHPVNYIFFRLQMDQEIVAGANNDYVSDSILILDAEYPVPK